LPSFIFEKDTKNCPLGFGAQGQVTLAKQALTSTPTEYVTLQTTSNPKPTIFFNRRYQSNRIFLRLFTAL